MKPYGKINTGTEELDIISFTEFESLKDGKKIRIYETEKSTYGISIKKMNGNVVVEKESIHLKKDSMVQLLCALRTQLYLSGTDISNEENDFYKLFNCDTTILNRKR